MNEHDRFKRIGGANGRVCKECGRVEVNCECSKLIMRNDMKAEEILSAKESYDFLKGAKRTLVKVAMEEHTRSQLQALKEEIRKECLYQGMNPNEADGVRNVLNLITNLEDK